ncbi:MAG: hypothetical protein AAGA60_12015 [Cyanobacteria bacterium P01_E01_bin.42]
MTHSYLSPEAIAQLVDNLPDYIKIALSKKSAALECSLEATIEMAIANFLDEESLSFEDCLLAQRLQK